MGEESMSMFTWQSKTGDYKVLQRDKKDKRLSLIIYFSHNKWTAEVTLLRKIRGSIMWQISPVRKDEYEVVTRRYVNIEKAIKIWEEVNTNETDT